MKRNKVNPKAFSTGSEMDFKGKFKESHYTGISTRLRLILHVLRIFGFLPFTFYGGKYACLNMKPSLLWFGLSITNLICQSGNLLLCLISYFSYDSVHHPSLVATVWFVSPMILFLQAILYQVLFLLSIKKIPRVCSALDLISPSEKCSKSLQMQLSQAVTIILIFALPAASFVSTCAVSQEALPIEQVNIKYCSAWSNYLYRKIITSEYWFLVQCFQFLIFFISTFSAIITEQWMIYYSEHVSEIFRTQLEELGYFIKQSEYLEHNTLLSTWMMTFLHSHTVTSDFIKLLSPLLLVFVVSNPTLVCLQAFFSAKAYDTNLFVSPMVHIFPLTLLTLSFFRVSNLALIGQNLMENVNGLSKTLSMIPQNGFSRQTKFQADVVMIKEATSPVSLTACQFLSFTRLLITAVIGATATYLIILVQMTSDKTCP